MPIEWNTGLLLMCVIATGAIVWWVYTWRALSLGVKFLDHSAIYSFLISLDIALAAKAPSLNFEQFEAKLEGPGGIRLFIALALATFGCMLLGVWFDARAEMALAAPAEPGTKAARSGLRQLLDRGRWHFWRGCHRMIIYALGVLQTGSVVMIDKLVW